MSLLPRSLLVSALVASWLVVACAGELESPERFATDASASCDAVLLLQTRCAAAGCHDAQARTGGLDLASPDLWGRLGSASAQGGPGSLLVAGAPEASVLFQKLREQPPFGARMPPGPALGAVESECLAAFIARGPGPEK